ncbi:MAG: acyl-CoA reductase-like NAD-dependent aldehyde dehydrogenase [Candidatus Azotimanducaceae bacterium]|jgi:acyl-CoA reductase-like NAD-dependent aldehyde dehydrogenase
MSDPLTVYSAWTREPVRELPFHTAAQCEQYLAEAVNLWKGGPLPKPQRIEILEKAAQLITGRAEELALQIALEGGKPYPDALIEAHRAAASVKSAAETLAHKAGTEIPMGLSTATEGYRAYTRLEPIGPVVAVSAFNHPLNLIAHQVAPAVAAGCPIIVKPANATPLSCLSFIDILREAGLPEAWARPVLISNDVATTLVTDPRVAFFAFIGSAKVGWWLRSQLAPGTRCALEHGGSAPVIIAADADLDDAAARLVKGGYYHAGQVCVSSQRLFVDASVHDAFLEKFTLLVEALKLADPQLKDTEVGPLINPKEVTRVHEWVEEAIASGARCVTGGSALSETAYQPTILAGPAADTRISKQEIFGPVTAIYPFKNLETAITTANDVEWAFQASIFTQSLKTAELAADQLNAAAVMINEHTAFRTDWMPFAGWAGSGHETGGIPYTFRSMTREKLVVTRS